MAVEWLSYFYFGKITNKLFWLLKGGRSLTAAGLAGNAIFVSCMQQPFFRWEQCFLCVHAVEEEWLFVGGFFNTEKQSNRVSQRGLCETHSPVSLPAGRQVCVEKNNF